MKKVVSKNIIDLCYYIFNILFGIFIGIVVLSFVFFIYDLITPGYYYRGFYLLAKQFGLEFFTIFGSTYGGYVMFTSFQIDDLASVLAFFHSLIYSLAAMFVLYQLITIFKISQRVSPFNKTSFSAIRKIGYTIILTPLVIILIESIMVMTSLLKTNFNFRYVYLIFSPTFILKIFFNWFYYAAIGLFFLFIGEVFNKGYHLK